MSLTSEMSRLTTGFDIGRDQRKAAMAALATTVKREHKENGVDLRRTMVAHRAGTGRSLRDIFAAAAFTRGAAEDLVETYASDRERSTKDLRNRLAAYVETLQETVAEELAEITATRLKMRPVHLKDLHRRVAALIAASNKLIEDFKSDRLRAGRVWEQRLRVAARRASAAAGAASADADADADATAKRRKPAVHKAAKKRKRTHA